MTSNLLPSDRERQRPVVPSVFTTRASLVLDLLTLVSPFAAYVWHPSSDACALSAIFANKVHEYAGSKKDLCGVEYILAFQTVILLGITVSDYFRRRVVYRDYVESNTIYRILRDCLAVTAIAALSAYFGLFADSPRLTFGRRLMMLSVSDAFLIIALTIVGAFFATSVWKVWRLFRPEADLPTVR